MSSFTGILVCLRTSSCVSHCSCPVNVGIIWLGLRLWHPKPMTDHTTATTTATHHITKCDLMIMNKASCAFRSRTLVCVKVDLLVLRALSLYLLLPWSGGLTDAQQDWQERSARLTLLLQRTLRDYVIVSHQILKTSQQQQRTQPPLADLLSSGNWSPLQCHFPVLCCSFSGKCRITFYCTFATWHLFDSFVIAGRGPAYSGPQHWDLTLVQCTSPRRGGELVGVCVWCAHNV